MAVVLFATYLVRGVDLPTTEQVAYVGQDVVLECPLTQLYNVSYPGWRAPSGEHYTLKGGRINQDFVDRVSYAADNTSISITNINMNDGGRYSCTVVVGTGYTNEGLNTLHVRIRPQTPMISNLQPDGAVVGTESRPLTLTCTSRGGNPAPNVTWYRGTTQHMALNGSNTGLMDGGGYTVTASYTFTPVRADDGGDYICQTAYTSPTIDVLDSVNMTLRLNLRPSPLTVKQVGVSEAGSSVTIRCTTSGFRPATGIIMTWKYKGSPIPPAALPSISGTDPYTATSTLQFPVQKADNGEQPECTVSHTTLVTPFTASTSIDVRYTPETVFVTNNSPFTANGVNQLTLTCTFMAGNPASTSISWRRTSRTGKVTQPTSTQNTLVLTPTRDDDGDNITCTANNGVGAVTSDPVTLDLHYRAVASIPGGDVTVTEGAPMTALTCTANSKPVATFTWQKHDQTTTAARGPGTGAGNQWTYTYNITDVHRSDAGQYRCQVNNGFGSPDIMDMALIVQYAPDVVATASVNGQFVDLTCSSSGVPNIYLFSSWVQTWPGYGEITRPILEAAATLRLSNLTYAHSGVYTCRVSNGVAPYGTNAVIRKSSTADIAIESRPIIITPKSTVNYINKVVVTLGPPASVNTTYYSPSTPILVSCYKVINNVRQSPAVGTVTTEATQIKLPVFSSIVPTLGTRSTVTWTIMTESGLGIYDIVVANAIGETSVLMEAVLEGPPDKQEQLKMLNIQQTRVDVSWQSGFHGGYPQTVVVQYSTDGVTWIDGATLDTGVSVSLELNQVTVASLCPGTHYYLRMYAHNQLGSSPYTDILNVTTHSQLIDASDVAGCSCGDGAAIIGGILAAVIVIGVIVIGVFYKKGYRIRHGKDETKYTDRAQTYANDMVMDEVQGQRGIDVSMSDNYIVPKSDNAPATYEMLDSVGTHDSTAYTDLGLYESTNTQQQEYENMKI